MEEESIQSIGTEERKVIFASSLGTVFEWYDFYLYAMLAPFFAALFFPPGNQTAALLSAFAAYAAGFLVRPFGALVFGRIGDLVGRKYTFLVTIVFMGGATFLVGLLPTYESIGWVAPILMVTLRLVQGLALGGEYGGAATYVAEHAPHGKRGYDTAGSRPRRRSASSSRCSSSTCAAATWTRRQFAEWGWRIPFWLSLVLLVFSIYIRLKLHESPIFQKMKAEGKGSKSPLTDSFLKYPNNKYVLLALLGATAGQGVVWYTGQFYALFFLTITLKLDYVSAYTLIGAVAADRHAVLHLLRLALRQDRAAEDHPGRLPDRGGDLLPAVPGPDALRQPGARGVLGEDADHGRGQRADCKFHIFVGPWSKFSDCDRVKDFLTKQGLSFKSVAGEPGKVVTTIGTDEGRRLGPDEARRDAEGGRRARRPPTRPRSTG